MPVFWATVNPIDAFPNPLALVAVSQPASLAVAQGQLAVVCMLTMPLPPAAAIVCTVGEMLKTQFGGGGAGGPDGGGVG